VFTTWKGVTVDLLVEKEDVWAASVEDKPGALAAKLSALSEAGADLGFIIVRRSPEKPGTGVAFVTPVRGDREVQAATAAGFAVTTTLHSVCVEGPDEKGVAAKLAKAIGTRDQHERLLGGPDRSWCTSVLIHRRIRSGVKLLSALKAS
jgi:hypothetical protein